MSRMVPATQENVNNAPFFPWRSQKATKGLTTLTPEINCDQTLMNLPPVTSAVLFTSKYFDDVDLECWTAGCSSGLRSRLRNQKFRVKTTVVSRVCCDEQLHLLTSHDCVYVLLSIKLKCTIYVCLFVIVIII
jgi:hypothetical protein